MRRVSYRPVPGRTWMTSATSGSTCMACDRPRAQRLIPFVAFLLAAMSRDVLAQTTRARGDYDKAIPTAPQVTPQPAPPAPQGVQPPPQEPLPRRSPPPAASAAPRPEASPAEPPVIIWQPSGPAPPRAPSARPVPRSPASPAAVTAASEPDASAAPRAAAEAFYRTYLQLRPTAGLPNATQRLRLRAHFSPALDAAFNAAAKAEQDSQRQGGGPLQEGDVFTSLGEGAGNASIGECQPDGPRFVCAARLTAGQGVEWQDRILLTRTPAGWRVDDISYGGRFANGNFGTLKDLLTILVRQVTPTQAPPNAGQPPQPAAQ